MVVPRSLRFFFEYLLLSTYSVVARVLPRRLALRLGEAVGSLGWRLGVRRSVVLENLELVFPERGEEERRALAAASCRNFGRVATEFARFAGRDRRQVREIVSIENLDRLREALREESGALVVTGHLGSWALYFSALAAHGVPTALLVGRQSNPFVDRFIHAIPGGTLTLIGKGSFAPRKILRCLEENHAVVVVADQYSSVGIRLPFLGHPCRTLSLPASLLIRRPRPLFLLAGHHVGGGRHRVELSRIPIPNEAAACPERITSLCNEAIGAAVLAHPEQYFWHHRRWKADRPERCA